MLGNYEVGYGKPPQHSQFKPGESGNSKGRPKGTKNLKTDLQEELRERILVREGERSITISKQRAIIKSLIARTLKGDSRTANTLLNTMFRVLDPEEVITDARQRINAEEAEKARVEVEQREREEKLRRLTVEERDIMMAIIKKANGGGDGASGDCETTNPATSA